MTEPSANKQKLVNRWTLVAVAAGAAALTAYGFNERWFEDDAMITMQYAKNLADGCGWSFNCNADDFATTSILHTFLASLAFYIATGPDAALVLVKIYESTVIVLATVAFFRMLVEAGIGRFAAALAAVALLTNHNTFLYMSSGMENALYLLALSLTFCASFRNRHVLTGGFTGLLHLVRPEAALTGPIAALADLLRRKFDDRAEIRRWLGDWTRAGASALAVAAPVWLVFFVLKGSPIPVSGEVKLLTAANWGLFHESLWPLIRHESHWLPFALAGVVGALYRRSPLMGPILTAALLVALYGALGLPKSPWYYLPLHFGYFAAAAGGLDLLARAAKRYRSWLAFAPHVAIAAVLVSPMTDLPDRFTRTATYIDAVSDKRHDINKRTGEWLKRNTPPNARVAIPNIGYIGFHGDVHLVDTVGLVTPDIARNRSKADYWYDTYRPELFGDKAVPWHARFDDPRYALVAVNGRPNHHRERYAIWVRSDLATERVRRSWTVRGDELRVPATASPPAGTVSEDGASQFEVPFDAPRVVALTARLDAVALQDERFPASDLVVDVTHSLPKERVRNLKVTLESASESGPGHATLLMKRGFLPERRQHNVLSQRNIVEQSNFNPENIVKLRLEYLFEEQNFSSGRVSVEQLEIISFSGCRLVGDCVSRNWE